LNRIVGDLEPVLRLKQWRTRLTPGPVLCRGGNHAAACADPARLRCQDAGGADAAVRRSGDGELLRRGYEGGAFVSAAAEGVRMVNVSSRGVRIRREWHPTRPRQICNVKVST
jgi:hypothetical protein